MKATRMAVVGVAVLSSACTIEVRIEEVPVELVSRPEPPYRVARPTAPVFDGQLSIAHGAAVLPKRLPLPVHEPTVVFDGESVWALGGLSNGRFLETVLRFNPVTETVEPTPFHLPRPLQAASGIAVAGNIYLVGGRYSASELSADVWRFTPATGQFSRVATLPFGRYNSAIAESGTELLVFGGYGTHPNFTETDEIVAVDTATGTVRTLRTKLNPPRQSPLLIRAGAEVYLAGGVTGATRLTQVDRFDTATGELISHVADLPLGLWQPGAMTIDGALYVYGGDTSRAIIRFDPATLESTTLPLTIAHDTYLGRGAVGLTGRGYVFGGSSNDQEIYDQIVRFTP